MSTLTHELPLSRPAGRKLLPFYIAAFADLLVGFHLVFFGAEIAQLIMPEQARILGFESASVLRVIGAILVLFAIDTAVIARSEGMLRRFLSWIVAAEWAWVAGSVVVIAVWHAAFSAIGIVAVATVAVATAVLAMLQKRAL